MNEAVSQIIAALEKLGASVTGKVWPMLVAQMRAEGALDLAVGAAFATLSLVGGIIATALYKKAQENDDYEIPTLVVALVAGFVLVASVAFTYAGILEVRNPDLEILKRIAGGSR